MHSLSVAIITYNEERNIARCIESVLSVADEIIVVDSFSTDKTEEICNGYNVRFIKNAFAGYIEQKNKALSLCTFSLRLSLDADECLSPQLAASILNIKKQHPADGYSMKRLTNYCGKWIKHGGWYPDVKIRLFNEKGSWGGVNPHDKMQLPEGSSVKHLQGDILHYSYNNLNDHLDQIKKFTEIGAQEAVKNGTTSSVIKIIYKPAFKFIRDYFFKLGILDGFYGFIICKNSAFATYIKYVRIYMLQNSK